MKTHVVMFSGGVGSWAAGMKVAQRARPKDRVLLLFADTNMEDEDLYRFLPEAADSIGAELVTIADGRNPWEVFHDKHFLGNTLVDPCSRILKRELLRKWLDDNCEPAHTVVYLGIDWTEAHRYDRAAGYWQPWTTSAPLIEEPMDKGEILGWLERLGIEAPRLYRLGFSHNNCGGFCIKAGKAHFANLLEKLPGRYLQHEAEEQKFRQRFDCERTILREQVNGERRFVTLRELRIRLEGGEQLPEDEMEWGGCSCFTPPLDGADDDY